MIPLPSVLLDAGHGGKDSGAVGGGWLEKDVNLEAALAIGARLRALGCTVGYTRTADVFDGDLVGRGSKAKGYDYFLSIHCNAGGGSGAEVLTHCRRAGAASALALRRRLAPLTGWRGIKSRRYDTGAFFHRTVNEQTKAFTNAADADDWYGVLRGCRSAGVEGDLLELFFLDNAADRARFEASRAAVFEAVAQAVHETLGAADQPPEANLSAAEYRTLYEAEQAARAGAQREADLLRGRLEAVRAALQ